MAINQEAEVHQQIICANIFIRKDDKWLVLKRSPLKKYAPNVIHPIGGKVDIGEEPYAAAKREVLEEAGVTVKNIRLEAVVLEVNPPTGYGYNWLIFNFSADYDTGEVLQTEEGELLWLSSEELVISDLFPSIALTIKHIVNPSDGTVFAEVHYLADGTADHVKTRLNVCAR